MTGVSRQKCIRQNYHRNTFLQGIEEEKERTQIIPGQTASVFSEKIAVAKLVYISLSPARTFFSFSLFAGAISQRGSLNSS